MTQKRYLVPIKRTSTEHEWSVIAVLANSQDEAVTAAITAAEDDRDLDGAIAWNEHGCGFGGYEFELDASESIIMDDDDEAIDESPPAAPSPPSYDDLQRSIIELLDLLSLADGETRNDGAVRDARALLNRIPIE